MPRSSRTGKRTTGCVNDTPSFQFRAAVAALQDCPERVRRFEREVAQVITSRSRNTTRRIISIHLPPARNATKSGVRWSARRARTIGIAETEKIPARDLFFLRRNERAVQAKNERSFLHRKWRLRFAAGNSARDHRRSSERLASYDLIIRICQPRYGWDPGVVEAIKAVETIADACAHCPRSGRGTAIVEYGRTRGNASRCGSRGSPNRAHTNICSLILRAKGGSFALTMAPATWS